MDDSRDERRPSGSSGSAPRVIGKVIKGDGRDAAVAERPALAPPRRAGVLNAEEYEAHQTAKQIIADAQKKAEEIKAEALRFKEEVFAKARDEAKADVQAAPGRGDRPRQDAGRADDRRTPRRTCSSWRSKIAEKIIGRTWSATPTCSSTSSPTPFRTCARAKAMELRVHPEDGKILREKRPRLMELIGRAVDLAIRDDSEVERGGCIIQTEFGTIDGQLRTQFEMLRNVLIPDTCEEGGQVGTAAPAIDLRGTSTLLKTASTLRVRGRVTELTGLVIKASVPNVRIGEVVRDPHRPHGGARRGGRLPGRAGDADAPGRAVRHRPRQRGDAHRAGRSPSVPATGCWAACSTASASPSTASPCPPRAWWTGRWTATARTPSSASASPGRCRWACAASTGCSPWARASASASSPAPASASRR